MINYLSFMKGEIQNMANKIIIGDKQELKLWLFNCNLRDRRNGDITEGQIVIIGNDDYDLDVAEEEIRKRCSALGYEVKECDYSNECIWEIDIVDIYQALTNHS